ncbi:hypothetical protein KO465_05245 [Candidatus Micrarchaeota archaeon]|nr:hypothetical protein [Candidatus Micrarchaeota archaeon]
MIEGGKGGSHTQTGLEFESRISLKKAFEEAEGYAVEKDVVYYNGDKVAELYQKGKIYSKLLKKYNINYKDYISTKLLPDDAIFVLRNKTMYIIEKKFQRVSGSVDEKLQTCDFKNRQYKKLFSKLDLKVKYIYILNDWFKNDRYMDVLEYVSSVGCYYFFNGIQFEFLGLPIPK